jgi:dihydroneopterin aldolase/2-amino-4-hydroxy-6-hydroxymethyldihydropteridine diphosphokinase/dihydropteroate synthase
VVLDLTLYKPVEDDPETQLAAGFNKLFDFRMVVDAVTDHVEDSAYKTVEAFVTSVAHVVFSLGIDKVTVRAEKPSAITFAEAAGVEITRTATTFANSEPVTRRSSPGPKGSAATTQLFPDTGLEDLASGNGKLHEVYIAFGSNEGDSIKTIRDAMQLLDTKGVKVLQTSPLYESEPMFVQDQNKFVNGVFKCETALTPLALLDALKEIEYGDLGRVKVTENGPRTIDLDVLLYDDVVLNHDRLTIPHIGMLQRSFVLQPLVDIIDKSKTHPLTAEPFRAHLDQIAPSSEHQKSSALRALIPMPHARNQTYDPHAHTLPTQIMAILNVTPDSFSDGGKVNLDNVVAVAVDFVKNGAAILDVGGMSTNPKSVDPGAEEELRRVVPAIEALRACAKLDNIPISIDTYRADVAEAALAAGADIINDISAGMLDPRMFEVAAKYNAPIILNHTRGTPQTMNSFAQYTVVDRPDIKPNSDEAVIECVGRELEESMERALNAGLKRWQLILDPGIGFAKQLPHNLAVIRNLDKLIARPAFSGIPWLLGPSRKRFIGTITGREVAADRVLGTGATVTALIANGADIVRVHDVSAMADVVKMSDAIYRGTHD